MPFHLPILLLVILPSAVHASILTNCADIATLPPITGKQSLPTRIVGKVQSKYTTETPTDPNWKYNVLLLSSDFAGTFSLTPTNEAYEVGDILEIKGNVKFVDYIGQNVVWPSETRILRHESPDQPIVAELRQIINGDLIFRTISVSGLVIDAFPDELDPRWAWILLFNNEITISLAVHTQEYPRDTLDDLIGYEIAVTGVCKPSTGGRRRFLPPTIHVQSIQKVAFEPQCDGKDIFAYPQIDPITPIKAFQRRCIDGRVLAVWGSNRIFVQHNSKKAIEIRLHPKSSIPPIGKTIRASGFAKADCFYVTLVQTVWQEIDSSDLPFPETTNTTPRQILTDSNGSSRIDSEFHGRLIRVCGVATKTQNFPDNPTSILLDCDGYFIPIDISSLGEDFEHPPAGTTLSITGVCRMEFDNRRQIAGFARIKGFQMIVRSKNDIEVLKTPPWWTPFKLIVVIGILCALLVIIFLWNISLRVIAERRGRELFRENVAHISADLRTDERTRLAVDLHDSLAQMLTGVSLQIDAGEYEIASKSLKSCRDELRNCLWDLRNQTLEERDMGEAIRRTLKPHIGAAQLLVRFNVPRQKLSDLTAHSVLMIVRELVTNAVRHGHAQTIRIAGGLDGDALMLSVRDNGTGFDPNNHPGMAEGHFGLQGIRERVKRCDGTVTIESIPSKGTRVSVSLKRQK